MRGRTLLGRAAKFHRQEASMAKGQKRNTREQRKPKQDKPKAAAPARAFTPLDHSADPRRFVHKRPAR